MSKSSEFNLETKIQQILANEVTELDLSDKGIDEAGAKEIAEALKVNSSLLLLSLWCNEIGAAGAKEIADALKVNSSIQFLNLRSNEIGDAGAKEIAEVLKVNSSLKNLNLDDNNVGDAGAKELAEALKVNTSLQELYLSVNNISDAGAKWITNALKYNYFITKISGIDNKEITEALDRNKNLVKLAAKMLVDADENTKYLPQALKYFKHVDKESLKAEYIKYLQDTIEKTDGEIVVEFEAKLLDLQAHHGLEVYGKIEGPLVQLRPELIDMIFDHVPFSHKDTDPALVTPLGDVEMPDQ